MRRTLVRTILVTVCLALAPRADAEPTGFEGFDRFVAEAMAEWQVPGLAVAAVRDGEVVLLEGYGVRDVALAQPVTIKTLFALGSVSKSFTAVDLALLAAQGRMDWDRPVKADLPDFAMFDPDTTQRITPRDLVTHRSGLPRHDVMWYVDAFDRAELLRRIRYLRPTKPLGEVFQYQNLMFVVASTLIERLSGETWEEFTRQELLKPLGMTATKLTLAGFLGTPDIALPYFPSAEGRVAVGLHNTDPIAPAGGLYSNAKDMSRYLQFFLGFGAVDNRRLIPQALFEDLFEPQIPLGRGSAHRGYETEAYASGLYKATYRGHRVLRHGGAIDGYLAEFAVMPDDGVGVVVLSNLSGSNPVPRLVALNLFDRLLGLEPTAWIERQRAVEAGRKGQESRWVWPTHERSKVVPRHDMSRYVGTYEHPAYGSIMITKGIDEVDLQGFFHDIPFHLVHIGKEQWQVWETAWPLRRGLIMSFKSNKSGVVDRLETPIADGPTYRFNPGPMVFKRQP